MQNRIKNIYYEMKKDVSGGGSLNHNKREKVIFQLLPGSEEQIISKAGMSTKTNV